MTLNEKRRLKDHKVNVFPHYSGHDSMTLNEKRRLKELHHNPIARPDPSGFNDS